MRTARLTEEIHVACAEATWTEVTQRLRAAAPDEACCFLLTHPSRGRRRTTVLLGQPIWPAEGEVDATPGSLELSADFITRALDAAADAGPLAGIALIHTHPASAWGRGRGRFSPRDDRYEARLFQTAILGKPAALHASIVLGSDGDLDARVYAQHQDELAMATAQAVRVVGDRLRIIETPTSHWTEHPDPAVMDRSARVLGREGQRILQNLRVGIAGNGGTGSITEISLATMGVGNIIAWDKDVVKKHNRPRLVGPTRHDVGKPKVQALAAAARTAATASPFNIETHEAWATSSDGLAMLRDCDMVFSCVDVFAARVPLADLAYAHLIPVVDMGSKVYSGRAGIECLLSTAQVWSAGKPCPWCNGTISSERLTQEAQGNQRGVERRAAYGLGLDQTDGVEPSVLPLNLTSAGLAMMLFMQLAFGVGGRLPNAMRFYTPAWEIDESDVAPRPGCGCQTDLARGEAARIAPYEVPDDAGKGGDV